MASDEQKQTWRNMLAWVGIGVPTYGLIMTAAIAVLHDGGLGAALQSGPTVRVLLAALLFSSVVVALGQKNVPISPRSLRNFLIWTVVALAVFALIVGSFGALFGPVLAGDIGTSATVALIVGLLLLFLATLNLLVVAAAHRRGILSAERSEALLEMRRQAIYSSLAIVTMGVMLVLLSLAGPGGLLSTAVVLPVVLVLIAIRVVLAFAIRGQLDELSRTVNRETGHAAFNLVVIVGGGWAIFAQLGLLRAPAPLDWLTMFTLFMFGAGFVAAGKRGLLKSE